MLLLLLLSLVATGRTAQAQVTFAGTQVTVAGSGIVGESELVPVGVALDGKGNIFLIDAASSSVIEIPGTANGFGAPVTLTTGLANPGGIAVDWSGNVYVADSGNNRILMMAVTSSGYGAAAPIGSGLSSPEALAVDISGNLFVADTGNNRIVELPHMVGGYGSGIVVSSGLSAPMGIAVDAADTLYIADTGTNRVLKEPYLAGGYTTQQVVARTLLAPRGVAVDKLLNVYIADTGDGEVLEYPWNAGAKRFNGPSISGSDFTSPVAAAVDGSGNLYIADGSKNRLQKVGTTSVAFPAAAVNSAAGVHTFNFMVSLGTSIASIGVYTQGVTGRDFVDAGTGSCAVKSYSVAELCGVEVAYTPLSSGVRVGAVVLYDTYGNALATAYLSGTGIAPQVGFLPGTLTSLGTQLSGPSGVAVDGYGNVYISDSGNNRVVEIPYSNGGYGPQITMPVTGLSNPMGMTVDGAGNLFIVSNGNDKVLKLPWMGNAFGPQVKVGTGLYGPSGVAVDTVGNMYVTDTLDNNVDRFPWTGTGYGLYQLVGNYRKFPTGVAVDSKGNVIFTMPYQNWTVETHWTGSQYLPQVTIPMGSISFPSAIAMDGNSNLYVVDSGNNRVLMLAWNGSDYASPIAVVNGLNAPGAIAVDGQGNLYIADTGNNQIVKVDLSTPGVIHFEDTFVGSTSSDSMKLALVENIGNLPLTIDSVAYSQNFPEDAGVTNPCSAGITIASGELCQLGVDFIPSVTGQLQDSVGVGVTVGTSAYVQGATAVNGNGISRGNQSISFATIADLMYGSPAFSLTAVASSGLPVTYRVISGPGAIIGNGSVLAITGAGSITIQASQAGTFNYIAATPVLVTFHVLPAVLTVTPVDTTATYGNVPAHFGYTITGFLFGQSAGQVVSGRPAISAGVSGTIGAGSYPLTASIGTMVVANYRFQYGTATLTVNKAALHVLLLPYSAVYASASPRMNYLLSGFTNGDTANVVQGMPQITIPMGAMNSVGNYSILPSVGSLFAVNYTFSFVSGMLKITPAVLTVSADDQVMSYGASVPSLSYTVSGFLHGDAADLALSGAPAIVSAAGASPKAGTYEIAPSLGSLRAANYTFQFANGKLVVNKAILTVVPSNVSMTYGGKLPSLTYAISGFVNGDTASTTISGSASLKTEAYSQSRPGSYPILASLGWLKARNYTFSFAQGTLTVNKAILIAKPAPASATYGSGLPTFACQYAGFVNGDNADSVQGGPSFITTANSNSPAGSYTVTIGPGTLSSDDYTFSFGSGTLTIAKAVVTVQANALSMVYGGTLPTLNYTLSGFANGDNSNVVSGSPTLATTATAKSPVGSYAISVSIGSLSAQNYAFVVSNGKLMVGKATLTLAPNPVSMTYGGNTPSLSYSVSGLVSGDTTAVVSGNTWYTGTATKSSPAGNYTITMSPGTLTATNYTIAVVTGRETVLPAVLTVKPADQKMTYGGSVPTLSYSITGFVGGDTVKSATTGVAASTTQVNASSVPGQYKITATAGSLAAANYTFQYQSGTLTVSQAVLTVAASNLSVKAGSTIPALTYTISGFVNGDAAATAVTGTPSLATTATMTSKTGTYPITVAAGTLTAANYTLTLKNGTLTLTQ